jgi:putative tryptophan/tyrosine transport system substrate-binding protein
MRRREFIAGLACAAYPLAANAQAQAMRRLGVMMTYLPAGLEARVRVNALETRLRELGWAAGTVLHIDYHWAKGGDPHALQTQADQLAATAPDLILAQSTPVLVALRKATRSTPLLFVQVTDPVGAGFVQSLASPRGRITGFTDFEYDIGGKWLELLEEMAPRVTTVTVIAMAGHAGNAGIFRAMQGVASSLGVRLGKIEATARDAVTFDPAATAPGNGLVVLPSPATTEHRDAIVATAAERRLPAIFPFDYFAEHGGLMSYGIDQVDQWSGAAANVARILRGEKPANLPVQQPNKFELVINMKTAKTLGINVTPTLLARADEVIE